MQKIKYFVILLLLLSSYSCKDDTDFEQQRQDETTRRAVIMEARSFFEAYAVNVELSEEMQGLYPGNFAPDWNKAVVAGDPATVTVNVPIVSDIAYEGTFVANYDSLGAIAPEVYYTAVGQKMVVAKDKQTGAFGCYIVTIVPDQANATRSSHIAAKMYDNGDPATTFSGTAFFTVLGGNHYPVAAGRYRHGERYIAASLWWSTDGDMQKLSEDLSGLMGATKFYARQKTMNKEMDAWTGLFTPSYDNYGGYTGGSSGYNSGYSGSSGNYGGQGTTKYETTELFGNNTKNSSTNSGSENSTPTPPSLASLYPSTPPNQGSNQGSTNNGYIADAGSGTPAGYSSTSKGSTSAPAATATPASVAPNATKLFKNATMSIQDWRSLEAMIAKIRADCMGGALFGALISSLKGEKLSFQFAKESGFSHFTKTLTVSTNKESNELLHEMLHAYQLNLEGLNNYTSSFLNQEFEAWYAQYLYVRKLPEYKKPGNKWADRYNKTRIGLAVSNLKDHINANGTLKTNESLLYNYIYAPKNGLMDSFASNSYSEKKGYTYDQNRNAYDNFKRLKTLAKDC